MLKKIDLEREIYRILSDEKGPSQSELLEELKKYSQLIVDKDKGTLSRRLGSLEDSGIIFHVWKKMKDRDQDAHSYYIKRDLESFKIILYHLAQNVENSLEVSIVTKGNKPREMTRNFKCSYIEGFIKSPYVKELIKLCGFKSVYQAYKERGLQDYCGIYGFYEHASLISSDSVGIPEEEFGEDFLAECEKVGKAQDMLGKSLRLLLSHISKLR